MNKLWYIHMDYYLTIKINKPLVYKITWMNFKITTLGERCQAKKGFILLSHFYKILENEN